MTDREQLNIARERVIDSVAQNMDLYGVTESIGRLYGMLLFQKNPMTLDEMKEELGMSKTSMSTSVRTLLELKMVDKVWRKGVRKDLYRAEEDWYQTFIDYFTIKWRLAITENIYAIEKSMNEIKVLMNKEGISGDVIKDATNDLEKMKYALDYYDWLERFVDSLESHEIFNFIPKNKE
ncbi:GbsR/MarR family transcriptional regulator [Niallia circulans]|jgi:DNA-binding transcriptional regulator GbsR (MarR family)|uniref:GbsR/MarR family transcriptional regulator n=1 Tax=Niallia circulans TaxID=1397 RepID=UPI0026EB5D2D|nr:GbsR/MarR family transcriptional regulator [Niallia circulans]